MRKLIFITFSDIAHDSRIQRHLFYLRDFFSIHIICIKYTKSEDFLRTNGINDYTFLQYNGSKSNKSLIEFIRYNFILKINAFKILKTMQHDIIWVNDFETLMPSYFANYKNPGQIVYDTHEIWTEREGCRKTPLHRIINRFELYLESIVVRRINKVITVSKPISDFLNKKWNYEGKIDIVRNIPDESETVTVTRQQLSIPPGNRVFVYIGSISRRRNTDKLITAFPETEELSLMLIGDCEDSLKDMIRDISNIIHINKVPPEKINSYLKIADIGIHPLDTSISINHQYALPNKIFQYMQAGLALCFFDGLSVKDIIDKHSNGIYGKMNTVDNIEANIENILDKDIDKMRDHSQKAYQNEYNWKNEQNKLKKLIKNL